MLSSSITHALGLNPHCFRDFFGALAQRRVCTSTRGSRITLPRPGEASVSVVSKSSLRRPHNPAALNPEALSAYEMLNLP